MKKKPLFFLIKFHNKLKKERKKKEIEIQQVLCFIIHHEMNNERD